jgi:tRNA(Ile)-lysidine synthase
MLSELHLRVLTTIRRHSMFSSGARVGVAVSGGADSVALLRLLEDLRNDLGIGLCVLHLNHALRGSASDADENFAADLARDSGLEFINEREDVAALARANHLNLEDAGRRARYSFFAQAVSRGLCAKIAVAHTADDQAETVLARILRGSGPRGIVGIHPVRGDIIRPLIETRRSDLREYLRAKNQPWREDESNLDRTRLRARLRHDLLPQLQRDYNPAIVDRLASLSAITRDEEAFWNLVVEERLASLATPLANGFSLAVAALLAPQSALAQNSAAQRALARRIVQSVFSKFAGEAASLSFDHVEDVLRFAANSQSGRQLELPGAVRVVRNFDRLEFISQNRPAASVSSKVLAAARQEYEYALTPSGQSIAYVDVPEIGTRFCLKPIDWPVPESDTVCETGVLDADCLQPPLVLRNWRPGDAFRLPGKRRAQKLKRLFTEARISVAQRTSWPVLTSAGRIAWMRGWPAAADFSPHKETRRRVIVIEQKLIVN